MNSQETRRNEWLAKVAERPVIEQRIDAINQEFDDIEPTRTAFLDELTAKEQRLRCEREELESKLRFIAQLEVRLTPAE